MKSKITSFVIVFILTISLNAQSPRNNGTFIEPKNETWEKIEKETNDYRTKSKLKPKKFIVDFNNLDIPTDLKDYKIIWHNDPVMQSATNTCWCFAGTSFLESEINRIMAKKIKMSEMHTVYYEYIEKIKRFIKERGNSSIGEGSQSNAVMNIWKKYGCVPLEVYDGKLDNQKYYDHSKMFEEINAYLTFCKKNNIWNEEEILGNVRSILNYYMKEPPKEFTYKGRKYTPLFFLKEEVNINLDDNRDFMSLMQYEFNKKGVYEVPDNWWRGEYQNINCNDFINIIKNSLKKGFTVAIGGDVSEAGLYSYADAAIVPSFDIPSEYIDDNARQFRFSNGTTGDDHGIHLVGYTEKDGKTWFLVKDSGSGAQNGKLKGYYIYSEDYDKLKMLNFTVHKDALSH